MKELSRIILILFVLGCLFVGSICVVNSASCTGGISDLYHEPDCQSYYQITVYNNIVWYSIYKFYPFAMESFCTIGRDICHTQLKTVDVYTDYKYGSGCSGATYYRWVSDDIFTLTTLESCPE